MPTTVEMSFSDLLDVLSATFDVPDEGRKALTSRLKHLQGKRFPPGVNVGRGGRVRYDLPAVLGTTMVLALTAAFMPPNQAVEVVRRHWSEWVALIVEAANGMDGAQGTGRNSAEPRTFAVVEGNALTDLGGADPAEGRSAGSRGALAFRTASSKEVGSGDAAAATVVDVAAVLDRALDRIALVAGATRTDVAAAIASMTAS